VGRSFKLRPEEGLVCKLFDKALVAALPCAVLAMCFQNALTLHEANAANVLI
jgi:hypothetical protein